MSSKETRAKRPNICCIVNCQSNTGNLSPGTQLYRFPLAKYKLPRRENWITVVRKQIPDGSSWQPNENTRICSQHFVGNKKSEHPLSPSYNPTIFSDSNRCTVSEDMATARFERNMKRRVSAELNGNSSKISAAESPQSQDTSKKLMIAEEIPERNFQASIGTNQDHTVTGPNLQKIDQGVQVHFPEEVEKDCKIFVCIKYMNVVTCDAETQAFIPENAEGYYKERRKYSGSDFPDEDKPENTQSSEVSCTKTFKCTAEFGEMSSISDFR